MEHEVKIVIGANYGDEGKGLMSRFFSGQFLDNGQRPVTVFHNGTAQRGHTADYENGTSHVFHNFCAGAREGGITYYADSFLVHPMDFCREVTELGYVPFVACDPRCVVVTPLDMLADHIIEDYIAVSTGAREYGSCCYGSWSATDRIMQCPELAYTVQDLMTADYKKFMLSMMDWVKIRLASFQVNMEYLPEWKAHLDTDSELFASTCSHFCDDLSFFLSRVRLIGFDGIWKMSRAIIFEGAQGLLLDKDQDNIWTTTSNTGLKNPHRLLSDYTDFKAEVCYVTRSYVTRHGDGPLDNEVERSEIGEDVSDRTNVFNQFQGKLRYALLPKANTAAIEKDFSIADSYRFYPTLAVTHCNEYSRDGGDYRSYSPTQVIPVRKG